MTRDQRMNNDYAARITRNFLEQSKTASDFHAHLDDCVQCRNNPFELCPQGRELLKKAV